MQIISNYSFSQPYNQHPQAQKKQKSKQIKLPNKKIDIGRRTATLIIIKNTSNAHFSKLCFLHIFRTKSCIKENKNIHLAIELRT